MKKEIEEIEALRKIESKVNFLEIVALVEKNLNETLINELYPNLVGQDNDEIVNYIATKINEDYVSFRDYAEFYGETIKVYF